MTAEHYFVSTGLRLRSVGKGGHDHADHPVAATIECWRMPFASLGLAIAALVAAAGYRCRDLQPPIT